MLAAASVLVMTFSAGFANRIFQFPFLMITIALSVSLPTILSEEKVKKALAALCICLTLMCAFESVAGSLYSAGRDSFYDRQTVYYHIYDTDGALPGNGLTGN